MTSEHKPGEAHKQLAYILEQLRITIAAVPNQ